MQMDSLKEEPLCTTLVTLSQLDLRGLTTLAAIADADGSKVRLASAIPSPLCFTLLTSTRATHLLSSLSSRLGRTTRQQGIPGGWLWK